VRDESVRVVFPKPKPKPKAKRKAGRRGKPETRATFRP
jgi:hypothetical protein